MNQKKDIRISISEVSERLGYRDNRTTTNWLMENNIPIKINGGKNCVFEFHVEYIIQLELAEELKQMYPSTWSQIYESITSDKNMVKAIMISLPITNRNVIKTNMNNNKKTFIT